MVRQRERVNSVLPAASSARNVPSIPVAGADLAIGLMPPMAGTLWQAPHSSR
jgi:hypothetical protein